MWDWGSPNSDDLRKSLALCLLCGDSDKGKGCKGDVKGRGRGRMVEGFRAGLELRARKRAVILKILPGFQQEQSNTKNIQYDKGNCFNKILHHRIVNSCSILHIP
jgi:hypothetical protein